MKEKSFEGASPNLDSIHGEDLFWYIYALQVLSL